MQQGYRVERTDRLQDSRLLEDSHSRVVQFYAPRMAEAEKNIQYSRGDIYTPEELKYYEDTGRAPIVMNKLLGPRRTVVGTFLQSMFDATFAPVGDEDQAMAQVLEKLAYYEANRNNDSLTDGELADTAFITGKAYVYEWPEVTPGERPRCCSRIAPVFAVYFDPDSKIPVTRDDAEFVDLVYWMSLEEILREFPEAEKYIDPTILSKSSRVTDATFDVAYDKSHDRTHETITERNGQHKVVERYFRSYESAWFFLDPESGEPSEIADIESFRGRFPGAQPFRKVRDFLQVAIWAPGLMAGHEFLFKGPYHVQPRNPDNGRCMWPVVELVTDCLGGESDGFVKFLRDPMKLISVMFTAMVETAKHAKSSYEQDASAYISPEEAKRAAKYGAHSGLTFQMKPGQAGNGSRPVQAATASPDLSNGINHAETFINEASAAPPALQGISESASTAASLNAQRIEQAGVQLTGFISYFKQFCKQRLRLRYAYWRECYTDEMVFRITNSNEKGGELLTINQMVPETDQFGNQTGNVTRINDIGAAEFDVVIVDSLRSSTVRAKQLQVVNTLLQNPAVAANPEMAMALTKWAFKLSDAPKELYEEMEQAAQASAQAQAAQQAQEAQPSDPAQPIIDSIQQTPQEALV